MRAGGRRAPTRFELLRAERRLERVRTGAELLTRRRRALVSELFRVARPAVDARRRVQETAAAAYEALLRAEAHHDAPTVAALGWPVREPRVELRPLHVWGVAAAEIVSHTPVRRTLVERGTAPGLTGPAGIEAASRFETLGELLLEAASRELLLRHLARALATTSRQVNFLERRVAPELEADIARIRAHLDEREREDRLRYKRLLGRRERARRQEARAPSTAPETARPSGPGSGSTSSSTPAATKR